MNCDYEIYPVIDLNFRVQYEDGTFSPDEFRTCSVELLGRNITANKVKDYVSAALDDDNKIALIVTDSWQENFDYEWGGYSYQTYLPVLLQTIGKVPHDTDILFVMDSSAKLLIGAFEELVSSGKVKVIYDDSLSFMKKDEMKRIKVVPLVSLEEPMRIRIEDHQSARKMPVFMGDRKECTDTSLAVFDKVMASGLLDSLGVATGHAQFDSTSVRGYKYLTVGTQEIPDELATTIFDIRVKAHKAESVPHAVDEATGFNFLPYPNYAIVGDDHDEWITLASDTEELRQTVDDYVRMWNYSLDGYRYTASSLVARAMSKDEETGMKDMRHAAVTTGMDLLMLSYVKGVPVEDILA